MTSGREVTKLRGGGGEVEEEHDAEKEKEETTTSYVKPQALIKKASCHPDVERLPFPFCQQPARLRLQAAEIDVVCLTVPRLLPIPDVGD